MTKNLVGGQNSNNDSSASSSPGGTIFSDGAMLSDNKSDISLISWTPFFILRHRNGNEVFTSRKRLINHQNQLQ